MNARAKIYKFYLTKGREKITQEVSADSIEKARKQLPPDFTITKEEVINLIATKIKPIPLVYRMPLYRKEPNKVSTVLKENRASYASPVKEVSAQSYIYEASNDFLASTEWKELRY